ncbi:R3H and coiled-coil domain-containing protein 1 [Gymnodraco acuticeps]|uniref:R3H and coiled-coil domain-containing protein 1 n=1 Tax=Gymnodraco acuticeps TaxID=8218 RepID=A0A6P8WE51_GYMAC|nr:R3H and coiled-coil domain-containing protein 1 [Gymnodraco acuticeps]
MGTVSIQHVHNDYPFMRTCASARKSFAMIEIYDFPAFFKTDDLLDAFAEYSDGGMKIEWVDDTHALGVFSSETAALHALSICHPTMKTRALTDASQKSKGKATRRAGSFLLSTLAFPCFDGLYLPKQENQFLHYVKEELETYVQKSNHKSMLLFPPLPSRLRYLIHRTVEDLPELSTFSVGDSWCRRVVVCHLELRAEVEEDQDLEGNNSFCEEPLRSREELDGNAKPKSSVPSRSRGPKRPDKPLYMPRAARERLSLRNSPGPSGEQGSPGPVSSSCSCISSSSDSCFCPENTEKSASSRQECLPCVAAINHSADCSAHCPQEEEQPLVLTLHEAEAEDWEQTVSCFRNITLEEDEKGSEDICTDPDDPTEEIKAHLKDMVTVSIQHVHNDYSIYENVCISPEKLCHVIEIYDFPAFFKTDDLLDAFAEYSDGGIKIEWVDDTHALGVFSSETAALHALSICHPTLKTRALTEASKKSKGKATRRAEFIQPVKERPRTDCAVARRMVTRALGLQARGRAKRY